MQNIITLEVLSAVSESGFSLDELVLETKRIVEQEGLAGVVRMMRELARRLKRMAFGWSEEGAAKMARIIIKRFTSANQWEAYWKKRLNIQGNVIMVLKGIKATSPQPLGR